MDTDSLLVDEVGYNALSHLIQPGVMGKLKVEYQSDSIQIHAPKDYVMGEREVIKGIRLDRKELGKGVYEQARFSRLNAMLQAGNVSEFTIDQIIKHQRRKIYSGVVQPDGWVEPFLLRPEVGMFPVEFSQESVLHPRLV